MVTESLGTAETATFPKSDYKLEVPGNVSTEIMLLAAGFEGFVAPGLTSNTAPMRPALAGRWTVRFIPGSAFEHNPESEEVIQRIAADPALRLPSHEHALAFAVAYPHLQRLANLVWICEPAPKIVLCEPIVLFAHPDHTRRSIDITPPFEPWNREVCCFATLVV